MNLFDRNFPDELIERCKEFSGKPTATNAVKETLYKLFEYCERYRELKVQSQTTESRLRDLLRSLEQMEQAEAKYREVLKRVKDPNAFYLVGD